MLRTASTADSIVAATGIAAAAAAAAVAAVVVAAAAAAACNTNPCRFRLPVASRAWAMTVFRELGVLKVSFA